MRATATSKNTSDALNILKASIRTSKLGGDFLLAWNKKIRKAAISADKEYQLLTQFWNKDDKYGSLAKLEETSVEQLQHLAKDKKNSPRATLKNNWIASDSKAQAQTSSLTTEERIAKLEQEAIESKKHMLRMDKELTKLVLKNIEAEKEQLKIATDNWTIARNDSLAQFDNHLRERLKSALTGYRAHRSRLFAYDSKGTNAVDGVGSGAGLFVPGLGVLGKVINFFNSRKQIKKMKRANLIDRDHLILFTFVRKLTITLENQLKLVTPESAQVIARYVGDLLSNALLEGKVTENDSDNELIKKFFDLIRDTQPSFEQNKRLTSEKEELKKARINGILRHSAIGYNKGRLDEKGGAALLREFPDKNIVIINDQSWVVEVPGKLAQLTKEDLELLSLLKVVDKSDADTTRNLILAYVVGTNYKYSIREPFYANELTVIARKNLPEEGAKKLTRTKTGHRRRMAATLDGTPPSVAENTKFSFGSSDLLFSAPVDTAALAEVVESTSTNGVVQTPVVEINEESKAAKQPIKRILHHRAAF